MFYVQQVYQAKEVIESNVQIKQALCATIIDTDRVCLGTEDGLFCIELMKESKFKPGILNQRELVNTLLKLTIIQRELTRSYRELVKSQREFARSQRELARSRQKLTRSQQELTRSQRELTRSQRESSEKNRTDESVFFFSINSYTLFVKFAERFGIVFSDS